MKLDDVVRSWKDEDYRLSLSDAEQSLLPDHPAGPIELTDAELSGVDGGTDRWSLVTVCGPSHFSICVPTINQAPCSWFGGCPTWGPVFCFPE